MRKNRTPKVRSIYNNYDLWNEYLSFAREDLEDNGISEPSDEELWAVIYEADFSNWEERIRELRDFFDDGSQWLLMGTVGRWNGEFSGGFLFDSFDEMWRKATVDCNYFNLYDLNGHFHLDCSHHDGTNHFEIKRLTDRGRHYYENWSSSWDNRSERSIHQKLWDNYSTLPNFAHTVYQLPKKEFECA